MTKESRSQLELLDLNIKSFGSMIKVAVVSLLVVAIYTILHYYSTTLSTVDENIKEILDMLAPIVVWSIIAIALYIIRFVADHKNTLIKNLDEIHLKNYFWHVQMLEPKGAETVEKFLNLAKEVDPLNKNFHSQSNPTLNDGTKLDACIKLNLSTYDRRSWVTRNIYPAKMIHRYFIVKNFNETVDLQSISKFLESIAADIIAYTLLDKNSELFRLVILAPDFNFSPDEMEKLVKSELAKNKNKFVAFLIWAAGLDLIREVKTKETTKFEFHYTSLFEDKESEV